MYKQLKKENGFTIIEVLIVLAIAGLILLIVFLAVPALQRNARNTSRKTDANTLLAAVNEYVSNNNGTDPATVTCTSLPNSVYGSGTTSQANLGYYNQGCAYGATVASLGTLTSGYDYLLTKNVTPTISATTSDDYIFIIENTTCTGNTPSAGSTRSVAAVYQLETGTGTYSEVCQAS
jgi:prepilin-type N-terminal cleavage/methylation domain-containing protein